MDALKIGVFRLIARFHQGLEAQLHELHHAAAENSLLPEEVGLRLIVEGGLHDAGPGAADARDVGQGDVIGLAGGILFHGHQAGHALAGHILAADRMAGALGGRHEHVHIRGGLDLLVADVKAMGKGNGLAGGEVRRDVLLVHLRLVFIVDEDHNDVRSLGGLGNGIDLEAILLRHGPGLAALAQADDDVTAGVPQVQGVGMALGAIAHNGDLLSIELVEVAVLLIIHLCHS
ncbi:putative uncharacterized protein [Firmicutes bacterium CAG:114]|nr:putative uncharacterized protein [Firmicutes bacterium CAG:114]